MVTISIQKDGVEYKSDSNLFVVKGSRVPFATTYELKNEVTGNTVIFDFFESTGSEWDKDTLWIYKANGSDDFLLAVTNDDVTPQHAENYARAKNMN